MKAIFAATVLLGLTVAVVEMLLRLLGLGNPPLYLADEAMGYRLAPNQVLRRFGNRMVINQYSMRSGPVALPRPQQTWRILLIGDSIVNGNWWTPQDRTLSALVANQLASQATPIEVLNASANSWGPRNQLAYLRRFGTFDAQQVLLVLNTDDLFGARPNSLQVGRDRSYPNHRPGLALLEVAQRLRKPVPIPGLNAVHQEGGDRVGQNLAAVEQMHQLVQASNGRLLLAMTPLKREVLNGPRDYEMTARRRLQELARARQLPYLDFLKDFQAYGETDALYRDHIHLSPAGSQRVARQLAQLAQKFP